MFLRIALIASIVMSIPCVAQASKGSTYIVPEEQWNSSTSLWMSRAVVSEVGWPTSAVKELEQVAVVYALVTRWKQVVRRYKSYRLIDMIRTYCSAFNPNKRETTRRWLFFLNETAQPEHWPENASWKKHISLWKKSKRSVSLAIRGRVHNPCPGANHFGGTRAGDVPKGRMARHMCSSVFEAAGGNTFYYLTPKKTAP